MLGETSLPSWYSALEEAILEGRKEVLELLGENPFPVFPPKYLRTKVYEYKFTDAKNSEDDKTTVVEERGERNTIHQNKTHER